MSLFYATSGRLGPMGFYCENLFCRTQDMSQCIVSLQSGPDLIGKSNFFSINISFYPKGKFRNSSSNNRERKKKNCNEHFVRSLISFCVLTSPC